MVEQESGSLLVAGEGLNRAHGLEQSQQWCGAIVDTDSICATDIGQAAFDYLVVQGLVRAYAVPWKAIGTLNMFAVDWPEIKFISRKDMPHLLRKLLPSPGPEELAKHQATMAFWEDETAGGALDIHRQRAKARFAISMGPEAVAGIKTLGLEGESTKDRF